MIHTAIQLNTSQSRGSLGLLQDIDLIIREIGESVAMITLWQRYQRKFDYAADVEWSDVMASVNRLAFWPQTGIPLYWG
jgi:hypothetical protein